MIRRTLLLAFAVSSTLFAQAPSKQAPLVQPGQPTAAPKPPTPWPTQDGSIDLPNFHFQSGETLPKLHLHYLTLGTPHRDAAGHTDNAVLLLHGTGGDAHSLLALSGFHL